MNKRLKVILGLLLFVCAVASTIAYLLVYRCGGERWAVKTLSDEDRGRVSPKRVLATVEELRKLAPPPDLPADRRVPPVELTTYVVIGKVEGIQQMSDRDFHLVISDPRDPKLTMITELVDPECVRSMKSSEVVRFRRARQALISFFGVPRPYFTAERTAQVVEITGVGFFDYIHCETGAAPNGIELHPVLDIRLAPQNPAIPVT
jgi:hypothetical protein